MIARLTEEKGVKLFNNEDFIITSIADGNVELQSQNRDLNYEFNKWNEFIKKITRFF